MSGWVGWGGDPVTMGKICQNSHYCGNLHTCIDADVDSHNNDKLISELVVPYIFS